MEGVWTGERRGYGATMMYWPLLVFIIMAMIVSIVDCTKKLSEIADDCQRIRNLADNPCPGD